MKRSMVRIGSLSAAAAGLAIVSGCVVDPNGRVMLVAPQVVVAPPVYEAPAPVVVEEPVMVPESYVVVNGEYMGVVGDRYFYLGSGGVWLVCDPVRLERFHGWEREHRDWREHAIRNDRFRKDAHGHEAPRHDDRRVEPGHGDQHTLPAHGDQHLQPGHGDQHLQPGHGDQHVQPGHGDQHVQPGHGDQHVQPVRGDEHAQPGHGTPAKAAPKAAPKKQDEKDSKDAH